MSDLAESQGGLVLRSQLVALGLPRGVVARLTRTGGPLRRLLPATYFVPSRDLTQRDRENAATLYVGPRAVITGNAALRHYGFRYVPAPEDDPVVHLLIPHAESRLSRAFVRVERTTRPPRPFMVHGLPLAPVPRALFDAARFQPSRDQVRATLMEALQGRRVRAAELELEARAGQRRWTALYRDTIREFRSGSSSAPEAELRQLWEARGLPPLLWNPSLFTPDGEFIAQPDAFDVETCMALEVESREYHSGPRWSAGAERHRRMTSYGVIVVPVVPAHLRADPERVIAELVAARRSLLGRPLPQLDVRGFAAA